MLIQFSNVLLDLVKPCTYYQNGIRKEKLICKIYKLVHKATL